MAGQGDQTCGRAGARHAGYGAALLAFGLFAIFLWLAPAVASQGALVFGMEWVPALGIGLWFLLDGLALVFALLITGIGALIFLYAIGYMGNHPHFGRLVLLLVFFMLAMLGLVLARDLITLFMFWELTSIASYLLIGFRHEDAGARRNALQGLLVTMAGGLALLAGIILIGMAVGSYDLAVILGGQGLQADPFYNVILVLVLLGAFTKSAQLPFHFWLPNAMAAPTPVSAWLHSATMVKAGVYLLARLHPVLSGTPLWEGALSAAGAATALSGAAMALRQRDLKQALAATTVMALGVLVLFLAQDARIALSAALAFLIVHALYKAALFMIAGVLEHATGSRDLESLGGLGRAMPLTALAAALAAASMAGLPPFLGWIGKELLYTGATAWSGPLLLVANAMIFAMAGLVAIRPFYGPMRRDCLRPPPWQMLAGPLILGALGLGFGLVPGVLQGLFDILPPGLAQEPAVRLHLWHGLNPAFWLSLATFALGALFFLGAARLRRGKGGAVFADRFWDGLLHRFTRLAEAVTRLIQTGRLSQYQGVVFAIFALLIGGGLLLRQPMIGFELPASPLLWLVACLIPAGALLALTPRSRIANIAGLGAVGLGVALIFLLFGAPDVAITQLMAESLSAVLFALALPHLPKLRETRSPARRLVHWLIAGAAGLCVSLLVLAVTAHPMHRPLTGYFEENAFSLAHGLNIVNVILVDFRAFDTFGELSVVLLASIGAWALLKRRVRK